MADINNNNYNLIAAIKHSVMRNGEVAIKLNDQYITGWIHCINMEMSEGKHTSFTIKGVVK